jgi:hypothetical protein
VSVDKKAAKLAGFWRSNLASSQADNNFGRLFGEISLEA